MNHMRLLSEINLNETFLFKIQKSSCDGSGKGGELGSTDKKKWGEVRLVATDFHRPDQKHLSISTVV